MVQAEAFNQTWDNSRSCYKITCPLITIATYGLFNPKEGPLLFARLGICPFLTPSEPPAPKEAFSIEHFTAPYKALKGLSSAVTDSRGHPKLQFNLHVFLPLRRHLSISTQLETKDQPHADGHLSIQSEATALMLTASLQRYLPGIRY